MTLEQIYFFQVTIIIFLWFKKLSFPLIINLFLVPGGNDGPSGVLVCSENFITYKHQRVPELRVPIPRRRNPLEDPSRGLIIVAGVMHKMKGVFFFLLQSEEGDIYKVTLDYEDDKVNAIKIKYFDTVPVAASLCILRAGFLFVAAEFGNQYVDLFTVDLYFDFVLFLFIQQ